MNALIRWAAENNLSSTIAMATDVISICALCIFLWFRAPQYHISKPKVLIILATCIPVAYGGSYLLFWVESGFRVWGATNIIRTYIWVFLYAWLFGKLLNLQLNTISDFTASGFMLTFAITHMGCVFEGCCEGYPCSWGIYNRYTGTNLFPVQILEVLCAYAIFFILEHYRKKDPEGTYGTIYPLFLILCGIMRFLTDFLRNNEKILLGMSSLSFHALSMILVGVIWFRYSKKHQLKLLDAAQLERLKRRKHKQKKLQIQQR